MDLLDQKEFIKIDQNTKKKNIGCKNFIKIGIIFICELFMINIIEYRVIQQLCI
jgi:hypothetical protein